MEFGTIESLNHEVSEPSGIIASVLFPESPSTQYLRFLIPETILLMVVGTKDLKYWVLGLSGFGFGMELESATAHLEVLVGLHARFCAASSELCLLWGLCQNTLPEGPSTH